jgi:hypothetical protein
MSSHDVETSNAYRIWIRISFGQNGHLENAQEDKGIGCDDETGKIMSNDGFGISCVYP